MNFLFFNFSLIVGGRWNINHLVQMGLKEPENPIPARDQAGAHDQRHQPSQQSQDGPSRVRVERCSETRNSRPAISSFVSVPQVTVGDYSDSLWQSTLQQMTVHSLLLELLTWVLFWHFLILSFLTRILFSSVFSCIVVGKCNINHLRLI